MKIEIYKEPMYPIGSQIDRAIYGLYGTAALLAGLAIIARCSATRAAIPTIAIPITEFSLLGGLAAGFAALSKQKKAKTYAESDTSTTHLFILAVCYCVMGAFIEEGIKPLVPESIWWERWIVVSGHLLFELVGVAAVVGAMLASPDGHLRPPPQDTTFVAVVKLQKFKRRWLHRDNYLEVAEPHAGGSFCFYWRGRDGSNVRRGDELRITRRIWPTGATGIAKVEVTQQTNPSPTVREEVVTNPIAGKFKSYARELLIPSAFLWLMMAVLVQVVPFAALRAIWAGHVLKDPTSLLKEVSSDPAPALLLVSGIGLSVLFTFLRENFSAKVDERHRLDRNFDYARILIADAALQFSAASFFYRLLSSSLEPGEYPLGFALTYLIVSFVAFKRNTQLAEANT